MNARQLMDMLEETEASFRNLFYPKELRPSLDQRIVQAIEERWPVYFPTRKECRGARWSISIPANQPLYKPQLNTQKKVTEWKAKIHGTIAESKASDADRSWKRFISICRKSERLRPFLKYFAPLARFLVKEERIGHDFGGVPVREDEFFSRCLTILLSPDSPYLHADPKRIRQLRSERRSFERFVIIDQLRGRLDFPLMVVALIQKCADAEQFDRNWLNLREQIKAVLSRPNAPDFRRHWLEHAMKQSGAVVKSGKPCPRQWAKRILDKDNDDLNQINAKAVEIHQWMKGTKCPSLPTIERIWQVLVKEQGMDSKVATQAFDRWLFSWMIALLMERHFACVAAEFEGNHAAIRAYYQRFHYYLKADLT